MERFHQRGEVSGFKDQQCKESQRGKNYSNRFWKKWGGVGGMGKEGNA